MATILFSTGVYLSQGSGNNSNILITEIGEGDSKALLCFTDLTGCCHDNDTSEDVGTLAIGYWLFPNGSAVREGEGGEDFYTSRGSSVVLLNRRNNASSPEGQFCCVVPDATFTNVTICANLCKRKI